MAAFLGSFAAVQLKAFPKRARKCVTAFGHQLALRTIVQRRCARVFVSCWCGPTIAAAFGSYDPKEVDACREAIVECMKNTPLDNGIRATGAVKEHHERKQQEEWRNAQEKRQMEIGGQQQNGAAGGYNNYSMNNGTANMTDFYTPRIALVTI